MATVPVPADHTLRRTEIRASPSHVDFNAKDTLITIIPNFTMGMLNLSGGDVGPFHPNFPVEVPLWLALVLRKKLRCTIQPPKWMSVDNLTAAIDKERASRSAWSEMPLYYVEVVRALIAHAREDFGAAADVVEEKLGELLGIRWSKVETGLAQISGAMEPQLNNISAYECNMLRPFLVNALDAFRKQQSHVAPGRGEFYAPREERAAPAAPAAPEPEPAPAQARERREPRRLRR